MENIPHLIELEVRSLSERKKPSFWRAVFGPPKEQEYCVVLAPKAPTAAGLQLPILIGKHEAMNLAIIIQKMPVKMPLTVDLFKEATDSFGYRLDAVTIDQLDESSIYHCTMQYSSGEKG
ncbi:bifunctional nuclease domain-containing protein [Paraflavitalea speifideaquila]|uniref:bifunctional nuclease domain-containing protein n=1 Tax=Paraflavitalea speifideaquila TaxID=3076558 RepID=UPI0028EF4F63|nr:bifunctional nuclease domain-containing protein [Paraflavitalea speifideiaquila]